MQRRSVSSRFHAVIADVVRELFGEHGDLPSRAWSIFRHAVAAVLKAAPTSRRVVQRTLWYPYGDGRRREEMVQQRQLMLNIMQSLAALPPRVTSLSLQGAHRFSKQVTLEQSEMLAEAACAISSSSTLQHFACDSQLVPAAAARLAQRLPSLTSLDMELGYYDSSISSAAAGQVVEWEEQLEDAAMLAAAQQQQHFTWAPEQLSQQLAALKLCSTDRRVPPHVDDAQEEGGELMAMPHVCEPRVDMRAVARAQQLRNLAVEGLCCMEHGEALARLTQLRELELCCSMGNEGIAVWAALAELPQLQSAVLSEAQVIIDAPPPGQQVAQVAQLTRLEVGRLVLHVLSQQHLPGSLAAALPRAQIVRLGGPQVCPGRLQQLASALQGLGTLQELSLQQASCSGEPGHDDWPQQVLRSLTALTRLRLNVQWQGGVVLATAARIVADAAGCAGLQELVLDLGNGALQPVVLEALAAGTCTGRVVLSGGCLYVPYLLPLFQGGGQQLHSVELCNVKLCSAQDTVDLLRSMMQAEMEVGGGHVGEVVAKLRVVAGSEGLMRALLDAVVAAAVAGPGGGRGAAGGAAG